MPKPAVDPRLRVNPLSVACSYCGAEPWHRCKGMSLRGGFIKERLVPHATRYALAPQAFDFARELGLVWALDREYLVERP